MTPLPRKRWPRRFALAAAALAAPTAAAHTATWFVVTSRMETELPRAAAAAAQDGWRLEWAAAHRAGWPARAVLRLDNVAATRDFGTTQLRWTTETLDLAITPADPRALLVSPRGPQALSTGAARPIVVQAAATVVRVPMTGPVTGQAHNLSLHWPGGTALHVANADIRWDGPALAATATGIVPTPPMAAPFDGPADLALRIVATSPFPPAATPAQSAALWQRAGGRLEVRDLALHLATLSAEGTGDGDLDAHLQPEGHATLRVRGAAEVLDAAAAAGLVAPGPASAARAVLGLLTLAAHGGPVSVPVELSDRTLSVSRFPLLRLPVLDWGGP